MLRRLLAFGAGAAVIGLFLLLVAFFESYIIVSQLQGELANQTAGNVNIILEDATLEAVFLGVMVALGYGLISQGLSGIRKQEMLELEKSEEDEMVRARVMAKIARERAAEKERAAGIRHLVTSQGIEAQDAAKSPSPETPAPSSEPSPPVGSPVAPEAPAPVAAEAPQMSWQSSTASSPAQVETPPETRDQPTPVEPSPEPSPAPAASDVSPSGVPEVVWEGGPPSKLEGVEVLPEPPDHGVYSAPEPPVTASTETEPPAEPPAPPKRGRGRPKGSKKKQAGGSAGTSS